jgi:FMN-dependent NADH-azoreductase
MSTILHVRSSAALGSSVTRRVGALAVARLADQAPGARIVERDLVAVPVPHLDPCFVEAIAARRPEDPALYLSDRLADELLWSDVLVIEAPMHNLGIPSVLKAWIDHVARAGKTFRYSSAGPVGLASGKQAVLVLGRGGSYSDGPAKALDFQEPYLRAFLGFLGINDVETIDIDGVARGAERRAQAIARAEHQARSLTWHPAAGAQLDAQLAARP